jgi:hypothetical protein
MSQASQGQRVNANLWVALLLSVAGFVAIGLALFYGYATRQFIVNAQHTEGTVIGMYAGPAHPEIEYTDQSGLRRTFPGTGWVSHKTGERVKVLYVDRGGDHAAKLDGWGSLWLSACMTGVIGTAALLAGAYLMWKR